MKQNRILALLLCVLLISFSLFGCGADDTTTTTTTTPPPQDPPPIDNAFEVAAKEALQTDHIYIKNTANVTAYYQGVKIIDMNMGLESTLDGENAYVVVDQKTVNYASGTPQVMMDATSYTTQIKNDQTYTFYVSSGSTNICITATHDEVESSDQALTAQQEELAWSVVDYKNVSIATATDGTTTYTCVGVRENKSAVYNELCEQMASALLGSGVSATFALDKDTLSYTVLIKDGKFVSATVNMEYDVTITPDGQSAMTFRYVYEGSFEYDYAPATVQMPANWNTNTDMDMTWQQYWDAVQQA